MFTHTCFTITCIIQLDDYLIQFYDYSYHEKLNTRLRSLGGWSDACVALACLQILHYADGTGLHPPGTSGEEDVIEHLVTTPPLRVECTAVASYGTSLRYTALKRRGNNIKTVT